MKRVSSFRFTSNSIPILSELSWHSAGVCDKHLSTLYTLLGSETWPYSLCKKASNHHANLPLEMYSFTL